MDDKKAQQLDRIRRYGHIIEKQSGQSVSGLSRYDGYVNLINRYGTSKDTQENYHYMPEAAVPDELLVQFYEGNGLFAKIIDTPADEALKHGFELVGIKDQNIIDFYQQSLEELDWEETASKAIRWARLFGGSIAVMLINDGRGIDEPLDWSRIKSIDDIRVYDRSVIQPDYQSLFTFNSKNPFKTRGSRLGEPEYYCVYSKYGSFVVHSSRCLVFRNGSLPENTTNSIYELWGMPEYIRIQRAIRDTELAHSNAPKMLEKSVQAIYKVKNLSELLATQEGEDMVLKRLQIIDLARGILNSMAIDADGEEYDFRSFQYTGVSEIIDTTCNLLSALTSIPQTILFGRSPAGMNATGASDMENYYSFVGKIQNRMLKSNLRYLLSVIFQAGLYTGEIQEVPKIKPQFTPLFTLSEAEQATIEQTRASTQQIKATTTQMYVDMQVLDPGEVRKKLAEDDEYDVENVLGEMSDEELFENYGDEIEENAIPQQENPEGAQSADAGQEEGNAPDAAPEATKLPQDMDKAEIVKDRAVKDISKEKDNEKKQELDGKSHQSRMDAESVDDLGVSSVGLLVIKDGKILCGRRKDKNTKGQICGPGGHVEEGETAVYSVIRETDEEFGIIPTEVIPLGYGPAEKNGLQPYIFICTAYDGKPECDEVEMTGASFRSLEELYNIKDELFKPFADSLDILTKALNENPDNNDGGPGSGNFGHEGRPGERGGSLPSASALNASIEKAFREGHEGHIKTVVHEALREAPIGSKVKLGMDTYEKLGDDEFVVDWDKNREYVVDSHFIESDVTPKHESSMPKFEPFSSEDVAQAKIESGELKPSETDISADAKKLLKKLGDSKTGTVSIDKDGTAWEKGDDGSWINLATGEIADADSIAAVGGSPLQYDGSLEFKYTGKVSKELLDQKMSEFARHQMEQEGTVSITSKEMEEIVGSISHYGLGGECQLILATQDPDHYQELLRFHNLSEEETASYAHEAQNIERYISLSDKVEVPLYRGICFNTAMEDPAAVEQTLSSLKVGGIIDMGHIASWSTNKGTARSYADRVLDSELLEGDNYAVVYSLHHNKSAASLSGINPEGECLSPSSARYRVTSVRHAYDDDFEITRYNVELEEV